MASETKESENIIQRVATSKLVQEAKPTQAFFQKFSNDWSFIFAGSLAYSFLTALFPILIALIAILGFVLGGQKTSQEFILSQIQHAIPSFAIQGSQHDLFLSISKQLSASAGILAIVSVLLAIFGGSRLFVAIENCLERNMQKQQELASKALHRDKARKQATSSKEPTRLSTIIEVVTGSALALVIELVRLRQRRK